jgi:hypothetical protein
MAILMKTNSKMNKVYNNHRKIYDTVFFQLELFLIWDMYFFCEGLVFLVNLDLENTLRFVACTLCLILEIFSEILPCG